MKIAAALLVLLNAALLVPAAADYSQWLVIASILTAVAMLVKVFVPAIPSRALKPAVAEVLKPVPASLFQNHAQAEVITLLGILQDKGRLVDFLMEDVTPYSDAEVGSVARAVHQGCKAALHDHFQIEPITLEGEGEPITVPGGYAPDEFRLVGNLAGEAPFTGKVVHKGWRTTLVKLPRAMKSDRLPPIAAAQIEIK